jgi:DNA primase
MPTLQALPPAIPADVLTDLRARIKDEVAATVTLTRSGQTWRGHCPFHRERTPSFHVYLGRAPGFHCFGCGAHGDVFDWLARTRGLDFLAAVAYLAPTSRSGPAPHRPRRPRNASGTAPRRGLIIAALHFLRQDGEFTLEIGLVEIRQRQ